MNHDCTWHITCSKDWSTRAWTEGGEQPSHVHVPFLLYLFHPTKSKVRSSTNIGKWKLVPMGNEILCAVGCGLQYICSSSLHRIHYFGCHKIQRNREGQYYIGSPAQKFGIENQKEFLDSTKTHNMFQRQTFCSIILLVGHPLHYFTMHKVLRRQDIPKASRETRATSPGRTLKNFFPGFDFIMEPETRSAVFTTPARTLFAKFSVATDMFLTLCNQ